jgi:hypothetical protein
LLLVRERNLSLFIVFLDHKKITKRTLQCRGRFFILQQERSCPMLRSKTKLCRLLKHTRFHDLALRFFLLAGGMVVLANAQAPSNDLFPVSRGRLCLTEGEISETPGDVLSVNVPKMRAYVNGWTIPEAEARFTYLGPTGKEAPLGSGEMRRQFGLKLLAQDACNLVYVMWRIEPESKLAVSAKSNPGQHTSAECTNHGYRNVKPRRSSAVSAVKIGSIHTLHAILAGEELRVLANSALVWEGSVGQEAVHMQGPVGIRSDNVQLTFTLRTDELRHNIPAASPACRRDAGE